MRTQEEISYCQSICNEAYRQLFWSIDMPTFWSWGVSKQECTWYKDMPTLAIRVSGLIHKGWVYISLNEGKDVYEIRLATTGKEIVATYEDVFCDELGATVDRLVEKPIEMTQEEYRVKALKDSENKIEVV